MKKKNLKNAIMAISLVAALLITGAFAYLTDNDTATNNFTVGDVDIDLTEPLWDAAVDTDEDGNPDYANDIWAGKVMIKDPTVTNIGDNAAFVYLKVTVPMDTVIATAADGTPLNAGAAAYQELFTFTPDAGWTQMSRTQTEADGETGAGTATYMYYYNNALPAANDTDSDVTTALFNNVTFVNLKDNHVPQVSAANIVIDAYAIQSNFGNGATASTPAAAWNLYAAQNGLGA